MHILNMKDSKLILFESLYRIKKTNKPNNPENERRKLSDCFSPAQIIKVRFFKYKPRIKDFIILLFSLLWMRVQHNRINIFDVLFIYLYL